MRDLIATADPKMNGAGRLSDDRRRCGSAPRWGVVAFTGAALLKALVHGK
jgi:hypothetical protein